MRYLYIDDSFFRRSPLLDVMRERLFFICKEKSPSWILISGNSIDRAIFQEFCNFCKQHQIQYLLSPSIFDIDGIKGVLTPFALELEGQRPLVSYSGTLFVGDGKKQTIERYYLDLFLNHHPMTREERLQEQIEHAIDQVLSKKGKKTKNYH